MKDANVTLDPARSAPRAPPQRGRHVGRLRRVRRVLRDPHAPAWTESQVWQDGGAPAAGTAATRQRASASTLALRSARADRDRRWALAGLGDAAAANLDAEMPALHVRRHQEDRGRVGRADRQREGDRRHARCSTTMMTAAMYHAYLMPSVQSDSGRRYRGMNGRSTRRAASIRVGHVPLGHVPDAPSVLRARHARGDARLGAVAPPARRSTAGTSPSAHRHRRGRDHDRRDRGGRARGRVHQGHHRFDAEGAYEILRAAAMDPTAPPAAAAGASEVEPYMMSATCRRTRAAARCRSRPSTRMTTSALAALADGARARPPTRRAPRRARRVPEAASIPPRASSGRRTADGTLARFALGRAVFADEFRRGERVAEPLDGGPRLRTGSRSVVGKEKTR